MSAGVLSRGAFWPGTADAERPSLTVLVCWSESFDFSAVEGVAGFHDPLRGPACYCLWFRKKTIRAKLSL